MKENSPFQEGVTSKTDHRPDKSFFQEPWELSYLINASNITQKFLPKQTDVDKILKVIQRKVLKGTHLPVEIKEIQAGYLNSPYFKDIYLYLAQNKLSCSKTVIRKVERLAEQYILLDSLLFKITPTPDKETAVLAVPENCADRIITSYHVSLFEILANIKASMAGHFNSKLSVEANASAPSVGDPVMYQINQDANTRSWQDATITQVSDKAMLMQTLVGKTVK